jgi:hypothetical protein
MITGVKITVQGYPEQVQRVSDTIEQARPGAIIWDDVAGTLDGGLISLDGWGSDLVAERPQRAA